MSYVEKCEHCKECFACFHMQGKPCETEQALIESDPDYGVCDRCGGDGVIEYNDGDPSDWGEDCPSEINHLIPCRSCNGTAGQSDMRTTVMSHGDSRWLWFLG